MINRMTCRLRAKTYRMSTCAGDIHESLDEHLCMCQVHDWPACPECERAPCPCLLRIMGRCASTLDLVHDVLEVAHDGQHQQDRRHEDAILPLPRRHRLKLARSPSAAWKAVSLKRIRRP